MHTPRSLFVSTWPALAAISLPIVPISCKINGWLSGETGLRGWFAFYLLVWIALSGGTLRTWLRSAPSHQQARIGIIGYGLLLALPCSLFLAFYIAAPLYLERTVKAGLASSLLPLGWLFFAPHYTMAVFSTYRWTKTLLAPLVSGTLSLLLADLTLWTLWSPTPTTQTASDATLLDRHTQSRTGWQESSHVVRLLWPRARPVVQGYPCTGNRRFHARRQP